MSNAYEQLDVIRRKLLSVRTGEIKSIAEGGSLSEEDANILYSLGVSW